MMNKCKRMDAKELAQLVVSKPYGCVFKFGLPHDLPNDLYLDENIVYGWYGCYRTLNEMGGCYLIADYYGGGSAECISLDGDGASDDVQMLEYFFTRYMKDYMDSKSVYVEQDYE